MAQNEKAALIQRVHSLLESTEVPAELAEKIRSVDALRPLTVLCHILDNGEISTETLKNEYGYDHPPRAARDVRELGIPLVTVRGTTADGRRMGVYRLDLSRKVDITKSGRRAFPKNVKDALLEDQGQKCTLCGGGFSSRALQIDHRVPYEIAGEQRLGRDPGKLLMLLCASCNRSKSWECESCSNWGVRDVGKCGSCYWSGNANYDHLAGVACIRQVLIWSDCDMSEYNRLKSIAEKENRTLPEMVKEICAKYLDSES